MSTRKPTSTSISFSIDEGVVVDCDSLTASSPTLLPRSGSSSRMSSAPRPEKKWDENYWFRGEKIAWHQREPSPHLLKYYPELVKGKRPRILLPLCSKSVDLLWLWRRGHEVVAIEDIGKSVIDFAKSSGIELTADDDNNNIQSIKKYITGANMLKALQTNFRTTNNPFLDHSFDTIWDRSGFASIPPQFRMFYAEAMKQLLIWDNFRYLLLVYEYEEDSIEGPPFSVTEDQIRELFSDIAHVSKIHDRVMIFDSRFRANKFSHSRSDIKEVIYLLQNK